MPACTNIALVDDVTLFWTGLSNQPVKAHGISSSEIALRQGKRDTSAWTIPQHAAITYSLTAPRQSLCLEGVCFEWADRYVMNDTF